jgi:hypothetical protein
MAHSRRYPAAIAAAVLISTAGLTIAGATTSHAAPPTCDGVWVVVQEDAEVTTNCATEHTDAVRALESAGFEITGTGSGQDFFVSQIGGAPEDADFNTNGGLWWAFCTANVDATSGAIGEWEMSQVGAAQVAPEPGTANGWRLGTDGVCPELTTVAESSPTTSPEAPATTAPESPTAPAPSPEASPTTAPAPPDAGTGSPTGTIIAIVVIVIAAGAGAWWWLKGRKR